MRIIFAAAMLGCLIGPGSGALAAERPRVVEAAAPGYPRLPSGERKQGEVVIDIEIGEDGRVVAAEAAAGPEALKGYAVAAARKWLFEPAPGGGRRTRLFFNFVLRRHLPDPPEVAAVFKGPDRVEIIAEWRELVVISDPPVEDVEKKRKPKPPSS